MLNVFVESPPIKNTLFIVTLESEQVESAFDVHVPSTTRFWSFVLNIVSLNPIEQLRPPPVCVILVPLKFSDVLLQSAYKYEKLKVIDGKFVPKARLSKKVSALSFVAGTFNFGRKSAQSVNDQNLLVSLLHDLAAPTLHWAVWTICLAFGAATTLRLPFGTIDG